MRLRATLQAMALRLDGDETAEELLLTLNQVPMKALEVEIAGRVGHPLIEVLLSWGRTHQVNMVFRPPRGAPVNDKEELAEPAVTPEQTLVARTIRGGQSLAVKGPLMILGDVNPGAEVRATEDIVVVGSLRGVAHAGSAGDASRFIWAMSLEASQLRIASLVARSPDQGLRGRRPERARVEGERIVIEAWDWGSAS